MEYVQLKASQLDIAKKLHILERKVEIAEVSGQAVLWALVVSVDDPEVLQHNVETTEETSHITTNYKAKTKNLGIEG